MPGKQHTCVCLNIEPEKLFEKLRELKPGIKRIIYVYDSTNAWYIQDAKVVASNMGITLVLKPVTSIRDAALEYRNILDSKLKTTDAIWLPLDNTFAGDAVLPEILNAAWQDKFILFSSNPYYVKRGGLFALYPDYFKLGKQIAKVMTPVINNKNKFMRMSAIHAKSAVNIRMARHLSLKLNRRKLNEFDVVYPHQ